MDSNVTKMYPGLQDIAHIKSICDMEDDSQELFSTSHPVTKILLQRMGIRPSYLQIPLFVDRTREDDPILTTETGSIYPISQQSYQQEIDAYKAFIAKHQQTIGACSENKQRELDYPTIDPLATVEMTMPAKEICIGRRDTHISLLTMSNQTRSTIRDDPLLQKLRVARLDIHKQHLYGRLSSKKYSRINTPIQRLAPVQICRDLYHPLLEVLRPLIEFQHDSVILNQHTRIILISISNMIKSAQRIGASQIFLTTEHTSLIHKILQLDHICKINSSISDQAIHAMEFASKRIPLSTTYLQCFYSANSTIKNILLSVGVEYLYVFLMYLQGLSPLQQKGSILVNAHNAAILHSFIATLQSMQCAETEPEQKCLCIPDELVHTVLSSSPTNISTESLRWIIDSITHLLTSVNICIPDPRDLSLITAMPKTPETSWAFLDLTLSNVLEIYNVLYNNAAPRSGVHFYNISSIPSIIAPVIQLMCQHLKMLNTRKPMSICPTNSFMWHQLHTIDLYCEMCIKGSYKELFLHAEHILLIRSIIEYIIQTSLGYEAKNPFPMASSPFPIDINKYNILGRNEIRALMSYLSSKTTGKTVQRSSCMHQFGFLMSKHIILSIKQDIEEGKNIPLKTEVTNTFDKNRWHGDSSPHQTRITTVELTLLNLLVDFVYKHLCYFDKMPE